MNRAPWLLPLFLLATALPAAAGDKEIIREALRRAVTSEPRAKSEPVRQPESQVQQQPLFEQAAAQQLPEPLRPSEPRRLSERPRAVSSVVRVIAEQVVARGEQRTSGSRDDRHWNAHHCTSFANCPFGTYGAPTFHELREYYSEYADRDLWDICLGRRGTPFLYGGSGACMMISSPDPWRPVDLPYYLERGPGLSSEETDLLAEVAKATKDVPGAGEIADASLEESRVPCDVNETLARKRPPGDCTDETSAVE